MTYMPKELQKVVGTRPIRPDGVDKVTGRANFGADMVMPGMLWGKVKRSPHAHARIMSIDTEKASAEAFLATRMGGQWGGAFGTMPTGLDLAPILERALVKG